MQARQASKKATPTMPTPPPKPATVKLYPWEDNEGNIGFADEQRMANLAKPYLNGEVKITPFYQKEFAIVAQNGGRKEQEADGLTVSLYWSDGRDVIFIDDKGNGLFKLQVCGNSRSFVVTLPVLPFAERSKEEYKKVFNTANADTGQVECWCPRAEAAHKSLRTDLERSDTTTKSIRYDCPADYVLCADLLDQFSENGIVEAEYEIVAGSEGQALFYIHWQIVVGDTVELEIQKEKINRRKVADKLAKKLAIQEGMVMKEDEE
jgi:hypothetical protein